ncbi:hypothetical protein BTJ40_08070 [Microbulbifer sp. A4B17]|nr:hypothetical protein BTJ40_08070 [Microbulbifer sp. A4B17]
MLKLGPAKSLNAWLQQLIITILVFVKKNVQPINLGLIQLETVLLQPSPKAAPIKLGPRQT